MFGSSLSDGGGSWAHVRVPCRFTPWAAPSLVVVGRLPPSRSWAPGLERLFPRPGGNPKGRILAQRGESGEGLGEPPTHSTVYSATQQMLIMHAAGS